MNTVPFDKLGPGQSGRFAYQVLGQNGPIFNPQNIRYLPLDSPEIPVNAMGIGTSGLSAGLAGANLIASILNLGVSVYIAHRINSLHKKMDYLQEIMNRIERKIDYIMTKVDRIDTQVAENNLRHSLEHVLKRSVSLEGVDLNVLATLCHDFDKFTDSLSSPLLLNFGLQLSSDIRNQLQLTYELAYNIRKLAARRYNISVDGDPERIITVDPIGNYFGIFGGDLETLVKTTILHRSVLDKEFVEGLLEFLHENRSYMTFGGVSIIKENLRKFLSSEIDSFYEIFTEWVFLDEFLPEDIFKNEAPEEVEQGLYDLGCAWLYKTDAGLLWRTWIELDGIADGYENIFWPKLIEAEPCGFNQIDVACEVPLLENA
ncbi:MAG: hypothetical protein F4Y39_24680 [Gemmatimonadetes bacterium]|nr:hypothetical protein [Gemmatimonadota bacterium]MYK54069.1 hypothetical protein [Gemmatimonadota bacterium]